jgi:hypothetical protein
MKPKAKKPILGGLAAVLVLVFFQLPFAPPSSGALYPVSELSQNDGTFPPDGSFSPHKTENFPEWKVVSKSFLESIAAPTKFSPSGLGTWWGATSNMGGSLKDITATPIPNTAWLFASGVLSLFVLKRRRPKT